MIKNTNSIQLTTVNGVKSIPVRNMPPEAWTSVFGQSTEHDVYDLARHVPWLYRSINIIAETIVNLPRDAEALGVLSSLDFATLLNELVGDYLLTGSMFACLETNRTGRKPNIRRFHPRTIKLLTDSEAGLIGFERRVSEADVYTYDVHEIMYAWIPSRRSELAIGDAPVYSALRAGGLLSSIDEHAVKYFESGAINPTIAKIQDFQTYPESEQERTKSILARLFSRGIDGSNRVAPVGTNIEFESIGSPMSELAVPELTNAKREDIATALGIPQSLLFSNATNYATAQQDNRHFYEKTILPLARKIESMFNTYFENHKLQPRLFFNEQQLEVFQSDEAMRSGSLKNLVDVGMPLDIALQILGYDLTDEQWDAITYTSPAEDATAVEEDVEEDVDDMVAEGEPVVADLVAYADNEDEDVDDMFKDVKPIPARYADIVFYPTDEMVDNAKLGLELRAKFKRGGTRVGLMRANQIANRRELLPDIVIRMYSYFRRHEVDKRDNWDDPENPTNGYIAWLLWGGDAGYQWAKTTRQQMLDADEESQTVNKSFTEDLQKWQRKAVKTFKRRGDASASFESNAIPPILNTAIVAQLEDATSLDEINLIFTGAVDIHKHNHDADGGV